MRETTRVTGEIKEGVFGSSTDVEEERVRYGTGRGGGGGGRDR